MAKPANAPRLVGKLEVATEFGNFLGDTRIRLLEAIVEHGSISEAARHVPISYKAAWDAVDAMNNLAQHALVARTTGGRKGGGTQLTEYGKRVIAMYRAVEKENQLALDRLSQQLGGEAGNVRQFQQLLRRMNLRTSARNQFACTITGMHEGEIDYEIRMRVDAATELVAVITQDSAEQLELAIGTEVFALAKASAVVLMTEPGPHTHVHNRLWGTVSRVHDAQVSAEVVVDLDSGKTVTAIIEHENFIKLGIEIGKSVCAVIKPSNIILSVIG
jgi:molybdate transport system regulatory protein